jgi:DNA-directed RNA polymerase specialized sigma subunit
MKQPAMTGAEIARDLQITRQDVSQILKRGMGKVYRSLEKRPGDQDPFDIMVEMSLMFEVEQTPEEISKFFRLYPEDLKTKIEEAAADKFEFYELRIV